MYVFLSRLQSGRRERLASLPFLHSGAGRYRHGMLQLMIHTIDPLSEGSHSFHLGSAFSSCVFCGWRAVLLFPFVYNFTSLF